MKKFFFILSWIFLLTTITAQNRNEEIIRFIDVTGSSEMEINPDEIRYTIHIKEYWKEEFEKRSKPEDYKTKVSIKVIEHELINNLTRIGISTNDITINEIGDFWREPGKDFLISKQLEIKLYDFNMIDKIIETIDTHGITYMNISELKNKNIAQYRKKVKIAALKAAEDKAKYLLASIGKQIGEIISITESANKQPLYGQAQNRISNISLNNQSDSNNFRKIKLQYEIQARFEIK